MLYNIKICTSCGLYGGFATQEICPACGGKIEETNLDTVSYSKMSDGEKNVFRVNFLGKVPADDLIDKRVRYEQSVHDKIYKKNVLEIECPYCHSTDTKRISSLHKGISLGLFGVFALGKSAKQWHCNNCNSDF